jgi:hypothetical protein
MADKLISFANRVAGVLTDATSVVLRDAANVYGLQRVSDGAVILAAGTALTHDSAGLYHYDATGLAAGTQYVYSIQYVNGTATAYQVATFVAGDQIGAGYFGGVADADAIAATLVSTLVASYLASSSSDKAAALAQASSDIDMGCRWQGRRYDPAQANEFPRVAYEAQSRIHVQGIGIPLVIPPSPGDVVWDYDFTSLTASVPQNVLKAVIYQADWILDGSGEERAKEQHAGVTSNQNAGAGESYDLKHRGADSGICRRAWSLLRNYELVSGRMF